MNRLKWLSVCSWWLCVMVLLSACAPDPRKEAEAFQIREAAEQDALNQAQEREQNAELHEVQMREVEVMQGHQEATARAWRSALNLLIDVGKWAALFAVCYLIVRAALIVAEALKEYKETLIRAAEVRANLIRLDPETRQYPVYLQRLGNGKYLAVNFNVNAALVLDVRSEPDRLMIQAMGSVQYAGALAREAGKSSDPAGVAIITPPQLIEMGGES